MNFIHLRLHSAYSLAEGALKVKSIPSLCHRERMPAVGVTDTNNLFGALEIASLCAEEGIQTLTGIQLDFSFDSGVAPILLYAMNEVGYKNLLYLASHLYDAKKTSENRYITLQDLQDKNEGLICLTGAHKGPIGALFLKNELESSENLLLAFQRVFKDRLYIELQRHNLPEQIQSEPFFIELAYKHNIPLVATNDVFFASKDMFEAHDALLCIAESCYVTDDNRRKVTSEHYFKSQNEMIELFSDIPEAIQNTISIAKRIHFTPKGLPPILPRYPTIDGRSEADELKTLAEKGLEVRLNQEVLNNSQENVEDIRKQYYDRLYYELEVIENMGFPGYFLIVSDFIQWAKNQGIPVGPGRGSGAGSLVAWATTITDMDPIRFNLIFERFLNPERVSMPDFDIDFCQDRRDEVIHYACDKYGFDQVAHIITFGKLQARAVLRDVGRVLQMPYGQVGKICDLVPNNPANPVTLEEAIKMEPLLQSAIDEDESVAKLVSIAKQLEGLYRHASTHAAGVVIGDRPLVDLVPMYRDEKSYLAATQFNMKYAEKAGLVKFDFLGLKTLTVIEYASKLIRAQKKPDFKIHQIPLDDKATFDLLCRVETIGIFQLESSGMKDVIKKLNPDQFENIISLVALYRPGPMDDIPRYIACKNGEQEVTFLDPKLEPILAPTYGVMVYQEQVMLIAQVLGGYSLGSADLLRRAMGKKIKSEMDAQRALFTDGAVKNGINKHIADQIFDQMAKFAGYGFNKSHSAPYALLAYQTAYLKANYPLEFYAASMTYDMHNTDKLNIFQQDMEKLGFDMLPPDINHSFTNFAVEGNAVRYALGAIKNVGAQAMDLIIENRQKQGPFKSIDDFASRIDPKALNKRSLENLISAGTFDCIHKNRRQLLESVDTIIKQAQSFQKDKASKQTSLFGAKEVKLTLEKCADFNPMERLTHEFDALGFYLTAHPLDIYKSILPGLNVTFAKDLLERATEKGDAINLAGILLSKQEKTSKTGKKYAFVQFSDSTGIYEAVLFSEMLNSVRDLLVEGRPFYIEATLKKNEESYRLNINSLKPLDSMGGDLVLKIPSNWDNTNSLTSLIKKLPQGEAAITLLVQNPKLPSVKIKINPKVTLDAKTKEHLLSLVNL